MFEKDKKIISIPGPVQAGKTEKFISIMEEELSNGKRCVALKFDIDTRFTDEPQIQSHNGKILSNRTNPNMHVIIISRNTIAQALAGKQNEDFLAQLDPFDVVGIDEAQFVDGENENILIEFSSYLRAKEKKVVFAGLDYWGVKPGTGATVPIVANVAAFNKKAGKVHHIKGVCYKCNCRNAVYSAILFEVVKSQKEGDKVIAVGGSEKYRPVCSGCV